MKKPNDLLNKKAPNFKLPTVDGEVSLKDFKGKKIVLYFYPRDNTPGCTVQANYFTAMKKEFVKENVVIIGVSKDSCSSHQKFIDKQKLNIVLLSDEKHKMQKQYYVWQPKKFMGKEYMGTIRTTFLINEKEKIINVWENVRAKNHAKKVLEYIKELSP